jgi:hypothetical protein
MDVSLTALGKISAEHRVEVGEQLETLRSWVRFEIEAINRRLKTLDEQSITCDSASKDESEADLQKLILRLSECESGVDAAAVQNKIGPLVLDRIAQLEQYFVRQSIESFAYSERSLQLLQLLLWSDMGLVSSSITRSSSTATSKFAEALRLQASAVGLGEEILLITELENEALKWRARAIDSMSTETDSHCGAAANDMCPLAASIDRKIWQLIHSHVRFNCAVSFYSLF